MALQNDLERIADHLARGLLTADQANVERVRVKRVAVIQGRLIQSVRKALNAAVKRGELGHMKKDGQKPEVYYHPTFEYMAIAERNEIERAALRAIRTVYHSISQYEAKTTEGGDQS